MNNQSTAIIENREIDRTDGLYYLDWLRVMAILVVFLLHSAKIFDYHTTDVFNAVRSSVLSAFREFNLLWLMPLFFAISGAAVFFSLKPGGTWPFVKARITRLLVPLIFSNSRILEIVHRYGPVFLLGAVIMTVLHVDTHFGFNLLIPGITRHDMSAGGALRPLERSGWAAVQAFRGLVGWCWIIGLLGTGSRLLNFNNKILSNANESVLPFYILHHSVILLVAAYVVKWDRGVGTKFFLLAALSMAIILAANELLVRRLNILRFLFGLKSKK